MTQIESCLEAEITHLYEVVNLLREEIKLLQHDVDVLNSRQTKNDDKEHHYN
jgi:hypothetical protein